MSEDLPLVIEQAPALPSDALVFGDVLSAAWRVERFLGAGGMARVYEAVGLQGEQAALKVMHAELASQPGALQRFLREGILARRVQHAGMVRLLGEGTTDRGQPYLALELLDGCTIDTWWRSAEQPSLQRLLKLLVEVLDLLALCHARGIVHRDLKPGNIYVVRSGGAKVLDFGVARAEGLSEDFLRPGMAMGTPSFMAPEQAMGAWEHVDAHADVFSIGATVYSLLSGQRLHMGKTEAESFTLAATRRAPSLGLVAPSLPSELIAFVDRALAWDKRARFDDAGAMRDTLKQLSLRLDPDDAPFVLPPSNACSEVVVQVLDSPAAGACTEAFHLVHEAFVARLDHQPAESLIDAATRRLLEATETEGGLTLAVLPWCLRLRDETVWAPSGRLASALDAMFSEGIRLVELRPDCGSAIRSLLVTLLDRAVPHGRPAGDFVTALWLLDGVRVGVAEGLLSSTAYTAESAVNGQRAVLRLLAAAGGVSERPPLATFECSERIWLDDTLRESLETSRDEALDGAFSSDLAVALREIHATSSSGSDSAAALRLVAADLLRDGRADLLLHTALGLCNAHEPSTLLALLPPEIMRELLLAIDREQGEPKTEGAVDALSSVLAEIGEAGVPNVLQGLADLESASVSRGVTDFIERHLPKHAEQVADALLSVSGEVGYRLVRALANGAADAAREPLEQLAAYESSPLRIVAYASLRGTEGIEDTVVEQLDAPGWRARLVALRTVASFGIESGRDPIRKRIESPVFHELRAQEQRVTLTTLLALDSDMGASTTASLVRKHGLLRDDRLNKTRVLAAELLSTMPPSEDAVEALRSAEAPMWWNPLHVREAASRARERIECVLLEDGPKGADDA